MTQILSRIKFKHSVKCCVVLSLCPFILSGCTTTSTQPMQRLPETARKVIINPQQPPQAPQPQIWLQQPPANYLVWLNQGDNKERVHHYEKFLKENRVNTAVPTYQLLRNARDWAKCGYAPYSVPSQELWHNLLPTLKILQYLVDTRVLTNYEITSVYRDYSLNICAGGAAGSKHVHNAAIDFRIGPETPSQPEDIILIEDTKIKLCNFWNKYGQTLNMGLGVYASGQIHIDTQGYRSWGPDHTSNTSLCRSY